MRRVLLTLLLVVVVAAGCSAGPASRRADPAQALGSVLESLDGASSAVATASLTTGLWNDGELPAVTADVALGDAAAATERVETSLADLP